MDANLQNNPDGSFTLTVSPSVKVFGITPAAWMSPTWDLQILPAWPSGQFPELPIAAARSDLVAVPGQDYPIGSKKLTLQKTDVEALNNRTKLLVLFGRITYIDVFEKSRWTDFCTSFDWQDGTIKTASLCPSHNDADWSGPPPPQLSRIPIQIVISPPTQKPR